MLTRAALLIATLAIFTARDAAAMIVELPLGIAPENGAVDVPTNVVLFELAFGDERVPAIVLMDERGAPVAMTLEPVSRDVVRIRPLAELQPDSSYSIDRGFGMRRTFHTGSGPDHAAPPAIKLVASRLTVTPIEHPPTPCGPFQDFDLDLGITEATRAPSYLVTTADGETTIVLPDQWDALAARHADDALCMTIRPRDLAGNLGPPTRVCVPVNGDDRRGMVVAILLSIVTVATALVWFHRRRVRVLV